MIRNYHQQKQQCTQRLSEKTLDGTFLHLIEQGANCPPFISNAILHTAKRVYRITEANPDNTMKPGQMKIVGIAAHEPAGKRLLDCQKKECIVTIYADSEDDQIRARYGTTGIRRHKLLRIATEAWEQGVYLTHEDFAYKILHCGLRTIARDSKYFKEQNIFVPTRGQQQDIGPGTSHKVLVVEYLLQRKDEQEIARMIYHSLQAIERYTLTFARVVLLKEKGVTADEIAFIVQSSKRLITDYLALYKAYDKPKYKDRINEILAKARHFDQLMISSSPQEPQDKKNWVTNKEQES